MAKLSISIVAAAALWSCAAQAVSIHFIGHCNGLDITSVAGSHVVSTIENGCAAGKGAGVGVLGTIFGYPGSRHYVIGENYDDGAGHYIGEEFWIISYPLVTGGTYEGWRHQSGGAAVKFVSGTYRRD
jgi:hypothetical protein